MTVKVYAYPFELGFLEFLYLAAFHGSLTVWLFRKKKEKEKGAESTIRSDDFFGFSLLVKNLKKLKKSWVLLY